MVFDSPHFPAYLVRKLVVDSHSIGGAAAAAPGVFWLPAAIIPAGFFPLDKVLSPSTGLIHLHDLASVP